MDHIREISRYPCDKGVVPDIPYDDQDDDEVLNP